MKSLALTWCILEKMVAMGGVNWAELAGGGAGGGFVLDDFASAAGYGGGAGFGAAGLSDCAADSGFGFAKSAGGDEWGAAAVV